MFKSDTLKAAYRSGFGPARYLLGPAVMLYRASTSLYARFGAAGLCARYCPEVWLLKGHEVNSGEDLTVAYSGTESQRYYLNRLFFKGPVQESYLGRHWLWRIPGVLRSCGEEASLEIHQMTMAAFRIMGQKNQLCLPEWVTAHMDMSLVDLTKKIARRDVERVEESGFSYAISHDPEMFRLIYAESWRYARARYGKEAVEANVENVLSSGERLETLLLKRGGEVVAGASIRFGRSGAALWRFGIFDKGTSVDDGVLQALYYFSYKYLKGLGLERISMGASRPFFHDGVLRYKKKWGLFLAGTNKTVMAVGVRRLTKGVCSALVNNPCITLDKGLLTAVVFLQPQDIPHDHDLKTLERYAWPGIERTAVYYFGPILKKYDAAPENRGKGSVVIRSANRRLGVDESEP